MLRAAIRYQTRKVPLTQENKGLRRFHGAKPRKLRKMRTGKRGKCGWLALMWQDLGDPPIFVTQSLHGFFCFENCSPTKARNDTHKLLRWHVCRANFARKTFLSYELSYEKCSEIFPEFFGPLFCGSEKSRKIPAKYPAKFPCKKLKTHRWASAGEQGEQTFTCITAMLSNISREFLSLCVILLGNKAHETSASWNYTLLGYTPTLFWGLEVSQHYTQTSWPLHNAIFGNLISNHFVIEVCFCSRIYV